MIVACIGHRYLSSSFEMIVDNFKKELTKLKEKNDIIVLTSLAIGADMAAAEACLALNIPYYAVLPFNKNQYKETFDEHHKQILEKYLALANKVLNVNAKIGDYNIASNYLIDNCDILIAVYNGRIKQLIDDKGQPINQGGTYHSIVKAKNKNKNIIIIQD